MRANVDSKIIEQISSFKQTKVFGLLRDLANDFEMLEPKKEEDSEGNLAETNKFDLDSD